MSMKIRLVEPDAPSMHLWSHSYFVRLGLPIIAAALKAKGHDVLVYNPQLAPVDWDDVHSAELVGLSGTTSTAPAAYEIADELRERGIPVVIGGSHVTFMAEEAMAHAAYVARGEGGEQLMLELVEVLEGSREPETVGGLSFMREGSVVHNPLRERCADLDELPFPDLTLIAGHQRLVNVPIMTSWGCPFACNFCSVTAMFGRKYRFRSAENVIAEIKEKRPKRIFFYDDNFAADKARLKKLLRMMIDEHLVMPWGAQVRTDVVRDPELLDLMQRSGADFVALGLESINQDTLDGYEKSQTVTDIEEAVRLLHEHGIRCHGMFVLGADTDAADSVRDTASFAIRNRIDTLMLNILTPLPGTSLFAELDAAGRILEKRWELYDAQHVVFQPRLMTPAHLLGETLSANRRFYSTRRVLRSFWTLLLDRSPDTYHRMIENGWLWWYARMWRRDPHNRAHERMLKTWRPRDPGAPEKRSRQT
jgi:anaerobic magnesium-protoporphyrin IX monomethyl ester cyclase